MNNSFISKFKFMLIAICAVAVFWALNPVTSEASGDEEFGAVMLSEGTVHPHVAQLQELLIEQGTLTEEFAEGVYDRSTREAVVRFQKEANIIVDGIAGPQTIGALTTVRKGDTGKVVLSLQKQLHTLGYYNAGLDGIFGPITHNSVKSFQKDENILIDGLAGPQTYGTLQDAVSTKRNASTSAKSNETASAGTSTSTSDSDKKAEEEEDTANETNNEESSTTTSESSSNSSESSSDSNDENNDVVEDDKAEEANNSSAEDTKNTASSSKGTVMTVEATAYTAYCVGCSGITFTGLDLRNNPDKKVIAVDPKVIPLGSMVEVEGYGVFVAGDIGGAIKGNKIDIFMPVRSDALKFGRRMVQITVLE